MAENNRLPEGKARTESEASVRREKDGTALTGFHRAVPIILSALAVFFALSFIIEDLGVLGSFFSRAMTGLFSYGAYATPLLLLIHAVFYRSDLEKGRILSRVIFSVGALVAISVAVYTVQNWRTEAVFVGGDYFALGTEGIGGGIIGSIIAFGLIKLFDYVGVIIIAAAVMAIYVTYFFSASGGKLKDVGFIILKWTVTVLAVIEKFFKKLFGKSKKTKKQKPKKAKAPVKANGTKKPVKKPSRKPSKQRDKLYNDEFFSVDNSIESLEISELGIKQKSKENQEASPTLQEKVHRKSDISREELSTEVKRTKINDEEKDTYFESSDYSEPPRKERCSDRSFNPFRFDDDVADATEKTSETASYRDEPFFDLNTRGAAEARDSAAVFSDSADAVFTSSFDPFAYSNAEALANKPSSKCSPTEGETYRESIHEITEEDVERARRNAQFERRKAMLVKNAAMEKAAKEKAEEKTADSKPESMESSNENPSVNSNTTYESPVVNPNPAPVYSSHVVNPNPAPTYSSPVVNPNPATTYGNPAVNPNPAHTYGNPVVNPTPAPTYESPVVNPNPAHTYGNPVVNPNPAHTYGNPVVNPNPAPTYSSPVVNPNPAPTYSSPVVNPNPAPTYESPVRDGKNVEYRTTYDAPNPIISEERSESVTVEKHGQPRYNEIRYTESASTTVYERKFEQAPVVNPTPAPTYESPVVNLNPAPTYENPVTNSNPAPTYENPVVNPNSAPTYSSPVINPNPAPTYSYAESSTRNVPNYEEPEEEAISYFTTEEESSTPAKEEFVFDEEKPSGLVFEWDGELPETNGDDNVLEVERTHLTYGADVSESDNEDDEEAPVDLSRTPDEDEDFDDEEIPPEKQNPAIKGFRGMFSIFRNDEDASDDTAPEEESVSEESFANEDVEAPVILPPKEDYAYADGGNNDEEREEEDLHLPFENPTSYTEGGGNQGYVKTTDDASRISPFSQPQTPKKAEDEPPKKKPDYSNYKFPPLDLLSLGTPVDDNEINIEIKQNTTTLIETLASFNVTASIKGVDRGPRITRYEVVPARGVKVNQITNLFDDIALNLAAEGIRMEAPIPGKSAIGFEIPNKNPTNVTLRELLECEEFTSAKSKTFVCIGKDVAGNPVFGDIGKFPHALVAGATGMGKSVCINSIMISMLYKARPDEVKFIMIDPKKVEFRMYSGIPHLLIPVITEAKQAAGALMWAVEEMERRYSLIEQLNIRTIESYNEKCAIDKSIGEPLPKIVIVIDELNDLMMQVRDPVEDLIMRIAQKARAAGIHLIIGTQRPDVKVVTGTIKANINTRISCKVTSVQDSRTILEMSGAEKLLNRGDMLFKPVDKPKPIRVQGCFVSDPEVEAIMSFLKEECDGSIYDDEVFAEINRAAQKCGNKKSQGIDDDGGDEGGGSGYYSDPQFLDAVDLAIRSGKVSTSLLQRKLSIGYSKAAKFIDVMEDIGIVSEQNGMKPREILLSMDEWHDKLSRVNFDN